ncbi:MAG TPA: glycoside hydrolase family 27 protein [Candidatus Acidoferrales bacterium]|nr:glycoside hydrolase family 27 protein [Candidatus Acidoferrales bacterium]
MDNSKNARRKTFPHLGPWLCAFLLVLILAPFSSLPVAQTALTGLWLYKIPTGDGNFREIFFDLKQDGETITGKMMFRADRGLPISDGTFHDGKLHFIVHVGRPPQTRSVTYDGTAKDGKLFLSSSFPGRATLNGVAERTTEQAMQPPARLPLPALHDVPDNGLARTPPMGWNSWNKFAGKVTDKDVRDMADAMVSSGMKDAGYTYINIDDTWEGQRDANGNITSNLKFPDMKALADYVHSKGLKIGIYSSPGPKTCAGYEGSYGHEQQDANTYAAWGFDYLKYDWCSAGEIYKTGEMQPVYQKMGDALLKTGRPIVFSLCQYGEDNVWTWGAKVGGNLWRTTDDINDTWKRMSDIGFSQFDIAKYIRPGHWNDPDMLEIGNGGMTDEEYRTHMSLWAMLAAPLLAGNDLRTMSDSIKQILTNRDVIAIDQDPDGKPVQRISDPAASAVVLSRPLHDGAVAVGLFNRADQPHAITVTWSDAGVSGSGFHARDLWKHDDVAASGASYTATVPGHGVVLLKITADESAR